MPVFRIPLDAGRASSGDFKDPPHVQIEIITNVPPEASAPVMKLFRRFNAIESKSDLRPAELTLVESLPPFAKSLFDLLDDAKAAGGK